MEYFNQLMEYLEKKRAEQDQNISETERKLQTKLHPNDPALVDKLVQKNAEFRKLTEGVGMGSIGQGPNLWQGLKDVLTKSGFKLRPTDLSKTVKPSHVENLYNEYSTSIDAAKNAATPEARAIYKNRANNILKEINEFREPINTEELKRSQEILKKESEQLPKKATEFEDLSPEHQSAIEDWRAVLDLDPSLIDDVKLPPSRGETTKPIYRKSKYKPEDAGTTTMRNELEEFARAREEFLKGRK